MKKNISKLFSLALALIMALALAVPAMAADITITNAVKGETYKIYKIFDVTKGDVNVCGKVGHAHSDACDTTGDGVPDCALEEHTHTSDCKNYSYTISTSSPWWNDILKYMNGDILGDPLQAEADGKYVGENITLTPTTTAGEYNVDAAELDAGDFASSLSLVLTGKTPANAPDGTPATADGELTISVSETGYYFVDTSLGSLCSLLTSDQSVQIVEKNRIPSIEKTVDVSTASVGDTLNYTITVTDGVGTDSKIVVYDYMQSLDIDRTSIKVYKNSVDSNNLVTADDTTYEIGEAGNHPDTDEPYTFNVTIFADYVKSLNQGDKLIITYSAVVNEEAITTDPQNTAYMEYSEQTIKPTNPTVTVKTYSFDLVKTDEAGKIIPGASFELYERNKTTRVPLVKLDEDSYRVASKDEREATGFTSAVIEAGEATIEGLGNGTYYLKEIAAPQGYNPLENMEEVEINDNDIVANDVDNDGFYKAADDTGIIVINKTGTLLPSTGGMGTTIFYTLGGLLAVGAVVLLVTKKRMHNAEG